LLSANLRNYKTLAKSATPTTGLRIFLPSNLQSVKYPKSGHKTTRKQLAHTLQSYKVGLKKFLCGLKKFSCGLNEKISGETLQCFASKRCSVSPETLQRFAARFFRQVALKFF
jgi:hypothetical protein